MAEENIVQDKAAESAEQALEQGAGKVDKKKVLLKERYDINFNAPLENLNSNGARAYKVSDRIDTRRELFALICNRETCPRSSLLPYVKSIDHPNIMKLVEYGIIRDPIQKSNCIALIYVLPQGGKMLDHLDELNLKVNHSRLKHIILGLISAAEALKGYGIIHRSIRPDNLFFRNKDCTEVIVGDCLASFPAYHQPAAYETIESLMAMPAGRGNGTEKNDIYAIGATCLSLLYGKELLSDLSVSEVIRLKMKKGSFNILSTEEKIPTGLVSVFKGLLADDNNARWNFIQTYNYLEGKTPYIASHNLQEKLKRSLTINGEKCSSAKEVAYALYLNPNDGWEIIKSGKLLEWVKNGLENDEIYSHIEKLVSQTDESSSHDMVISQICILLDHAAPIHIRDISVFPDGASKAIYYCMQHNINLNNFHDLFNSELIRNWYLEQPDLRTPMNLSEFRININRKDIGYGLERIIYELDEDLPCLSPLLGEEYVNTGARVLKALDANYPNIKGEIRPYDKNIIAFLRCKLGKKIDGIILDLNANKEGMQISAIIRLYADMQKKYGPVQLINLGQWLSSISKPVIESYHNLKLQKKIEKDLAKVAKSGKIIEICQALEDPEIKEKDTEMFRKVKKEIISLLSEKNKLLTQNGRIIEEAKENAIKFASILAVMTMIASFTFNLMQWISQ